MRPIVVGLLASLLGIPFTASALLPPDACVDANGVMASGLSWTPPCVRILSGDAITWTNAGDRPHDLRSSQDDVAALRNLAPHCFAAGILEVGARATIRFTADSEDVDASMRRPDGTWEPARSCRIASVPTGIVGEATIPYKCALHPGMTGRVVVRPMTIVVG